MGATLGCQTAIPEDMTKISRRLAEIEGALHGVESGLGDLEARIHPSLQPETANRVEKDAVCSREDTPIDSPLAGKLSSIYGHIKRIDSIVMSLYGRCEL